MDVKHTRKLLFDFVCQKKQQFLQNANYADANTENYKKKWNFPSHVEYCAEKHVRHDDKKNPSHLFQCLIRSTNL